jgi:diguanylate cyclase (GGDEF)-like protein
VKDLGVAATAWSPDAKPIPDPLGRAVAEMGVAVELTDDGDALVNAARRRRPSLIFVDATGDSVAMASATELLGRLKRDAYTALVPTLILAPRTAAVRWLDRGADDVLDPDEPALGVARITAALRRNGRDLTAQATTRLPAASAIDAEIERRIAAGAPFAACYADLDHFKEYNDRYGFREGDRVIRMLARVLYDSALGSGGEDAFVGHIGGDDFMLVIPLERAGAVCELAIEVFDTLAPLQYSEADRRAGYYFGKDRRGQLHRVPLMSLSIGAATTERRRLRNAAEVSRLASEMKSFAKARPGSVFAVDRRSDDDQAGPTSGTP